MKQSELDLIAAAFVRLPYATRLALWHALETQECYPTDKSEDAAANRLRDALRRAGVDK